MSPSWVRAAHGQGWASSGIWEPQRSAAVERPLSESRRTKGFGSTSLACSRSVPSSPSPPALPWLTQHASLVCTAMLWSLTVHAGV